MAAAGRVETASGGLAGNASALSAEETAFATSLANDGQGRLFENRPSAGDADAEKKALVRQTLDADAKYSGGIVQYVKNAPLDATDTTTMLLNRLLERRAALPPLPVLPHAERLPSGERGLSLAALQGIRRFYDRHGGLSKTMGDVCKEEGFAASVVALTRGSGLSLAETLAIEGEAAGVDVSGIVGRASDFFSYSWTGTRLEDMLGSIADVAPLLRRAEGELRLWVDMFAASQNLLAGAFRDEAHPKGSAGYAARKEDTDRIFDDALLTVRSVVFYCSPLVGEWVAPRHGFLSPERDERGVEHPWHRHGPAAISRAPLPEPSCRPSDATPLPLCAAASRATHSLSRAAQERGASLS